MRIGSAILGRPSRLIAALAVLALIGPTMDANAQTRPERAPFVELSPSNGDAQTQINVAGWANCPGEEAEVQFFFDEEFAGSTALIWPAPDENFELHDEWDFFGGFTPATVVNDRPIDPGPHTVTIACDISGAATQASAEFVVEGAPPAGDEGGGGIQFFWKGKESGRLPTPTERVNSVGSLPTGTECDALFIFFDGEQVANERTHIDRRSFSGVTFQIPGDAEPGEHPVFASCDQSGEPVVLSGVLSVGSGTPARAVSGNPNRSRFAGSVLAVGDIDWSPRHVGLNFLVALLLLLLVFPAELFNSTLDANYEEVKGWFGLGKREKPAEERAGGLRRSWVAFAAFALVSSVVYGFLDSSFGVNKASFTLFLGLVTGLVVVTFIFGLPTRLYMKKTHGEAGNINVLFGALIAAAVCVVISRVVNFAPGYMYGVLAGFVFRSELRKDEEGRLGAISIFFMLAVAVAAWLAWIPVKAAAEDVNASLAVLVLDAILVAIFVGGVEGSFLGLIPMRFLKGESVFKWRKVIWGLLFLSSTFAFIHILLRPGSEATNTPLVTVVALFLGFGAFSVAFWSYFRFRKERAEL